MCALRLGAGRDKIASFPANALALAPMPCQILWQARAVHAEPMHHTAPPAPAQAAAAAAGDGSGPGSLLLHAHLPIHEHRAHTGQSVLGLRCGLPMWALGLVCRYWRPWGPALRCGQPSATRPFARRACAGLQRQLCGVSVDHNCQQPAERGHRAAGAGARTGRGGRGRQHTGGRSCCLLPGWAGLRWLGGRAEVAACVVGIGTWACKRVGRGALAQGLNSI